LKDFFANVEIGGPRLFDDFRKVDELFGSIENTEGADNRKASLLGNVSAVTFVDEKPIRLEFPSMGNNSSFARFKVK
jgi:hypothetical protein